MITTLIFEMNDEEFGLAAGADRLVVNVPQSDGRAAVQQWELTTGKPVGPPVTIDEEGYDSRPYAMSIGGAGTAVLTDNADGSGLILHFLTPDGQLAWQVEASDGGEWSRDGEPGWSVDADAISTAVVGDSVLLQSADGTSAFSAVTGEPVDPPEGLRDRGRLEPQLTSDGAVWAVADHEGDGLSTVTLYDPGTDSQIYQASGLEHVPTSGLSVDGRLWAGKSGELVRYSLDGVAQLLDLEGIVDSRAVDLGLCGDQAWWLADGRLVVSDLRTGERLWTHQISSDFDLDETGLHIFDDGVLVIGETVQVAEGQFDTRFAVEVFK